MGMRRRMRRRGLSHQLAYGARGNWGKVRMKTISKQTGVVTHNYNPSYSIGRGQEDHGLVPALAKIS
jgi:hypothetical protein